MVAWVRFVIGAGFEHVVPPRCPLEPGRSAARALDSRRRSRILASANRVNGHAGYLDGSRAIRTGRFLCGDFCFWASRRLRWSRPVSRRRARAATRPARPSFKGIYASFLDPATGTFFSNQAACVSFVAKGGTLNPGVDLALSSPAPGAVTLRNNSPFTSTYTVAYGINLTGGTSAAWVSAGCNGSPPPGYLYGNTCTGTIGPGQSIALFFNVFVGAGTTLAGLASITQAQFPDPVTSNNRVSTSAG